MKKIDDYKVSVLITLSIVMGGFLIAQSLHVSSPLAMVVAGLIIGNYGKKVAMSEVTKDYLEKFWELIDEILNAIHPHPTIYGSQVATPNHIGYPHGNTQPYMLPTWHK